MNLEEKYGKGISISEFRSIVIENGLKYCSCDLEDWENHYIPIGFLAPNNKVFWCDLILSEEAYQSAQQAGWVDLDAISKGAVIYFTVRDEESLDFKATSLSELFKLLKEPAVDLSMEKLAYLLEPSCTRVTDEPDWLEIKFRFETMFYDRDCFMPPNDLTDEIMTVLDQKIAEEEEACKDIKKPEKYSCYVATKLPKESKFLYPVIWKVATVREARVFIHDDSPFVHVMIPLKVFWDLCEPIKEVIPKFGKALRQYFWELYDNNFLKSLADYSWYDCEDRERCCSLGSLRFTEHGVFAKGVDDYVQPEIVDFPTKLNNMLKDGQSILFMGSEGDEYFRMVARFASDVERYFNRDDRILSMMYGLRERARLLAAISRGDSVASIEQCVVMREENKDVTDSMTAF